MENLHLETRAAFAGYDETTGQGAVKPPIHLASTFVFPDAKTGAQHMEAAYGVPGVEAPKEGFIYSRLGNPTVQVAERRLAVWDGAEQSAMFSSGMAAISTALLAWSGADRPVWYCPPLYGGTDHFVAEVMPGMGVETRRLGGLERLDALLAESGRLPGVIYLETPANPTLQVHRIRTAADWAKKHSTAEHRILVMVDNTYLGPIMQRPLEHGADLILYSATKYIGGHSDLVAGAVSGAADAVGQVVGHRHFLGGMIDPWTAWLLNRSMETLHIRMERQQASAIKVASWLRNHADVQRLLTAQSEDLSPADAAIMEEQTTGRGAMIAFEVAGGREAAFHVLDALKHFKLAVSLGSTESLAEHPASMTHAGVPQETKVAYGITEGLVRLSIGIEHPDDLIADLDHALKSLVQQETLDAF